MKIKRIEVSNFRALREASLTFAQTTALVGENNAGKSAFLMALELFFMNAPKVGEKDFSDGNTKIPIDVTIHFANFTPYDLGEFSSNLIDGELVVTRRLLFGNPSESGKFFVSAKVNPAFSACRNEDGKTEKRKLYSELREKYGNPPELPKEKNADEIDAYLEAWEEKHPESLKMEKVAGFKGWKNVAVGKLKEKTDYIFIRAVQDAQEDIQQNKNSPVKNLINTIARQTIENNVNFQNFMKEANVKIAEFTDPNQVPALKEISGALTKILTGYYKDSSIIASWTPIDTIQPSFPTSEIEVRDNDFTTNIDGVGHGLQRAVILTVLQYMAEHRARDENSGFEEAQSDIIIAIEEPEVYQHPIKQRLFAKVLNSLAKEFNKETGIRIQTIYVTHSPLLVSLPNCDQIRVVRFDAKSKNVCVAETTLDACSQKSAQLYKLDENQAWSAEQFGSKLHTFRGETAEGFFAKCVVLVEGVGDKSVLDAWFQLIDRDPHAEGIVIADVVGKNNLGKPVVIFQELGIPCYWIFDNDQTSDKSEADKLRENKALQRMAGVVDEKCVDFPTGVFSNFAAWDGKLEKYIAEVGGEHFEPIKNQTATDYDVWPRDTLKSPGPAAAVIRALREKKCDFDQLEKIVLAIDGLLK